MSRPVPTTSSTTTSVAKTRRAASQPPTRVTPPKSAATASAAAAAEPVFTYVAPRDVAESIKWHGYRLGREMLPLPHCMVSSEDLARPKYTKIKSAEYEDAPEVLERKADVLIDMFRGAKHPMIYAGAGISTSSGIWDYASNAKGSLVQAKKGALTRALIDSLQPTLAHRVLTAMERAGMIEHWLQQNHDGLAHKAGFPVEKINEIHGSWHDKTNPVVKMSGGLRDDLFQWMLEWEDRADMVFAVGTSFSGLNADRVSQSCARRHLDGGVGQGLAIITIQATPMDDVAGLRIYCRIDKFMEIVRRKLGLEVDTKTYPYRALPAARRTAV